MLNLPFGQLAFMNPWILTGLLALPLLWFLLRVFPPAPRLIRLPGAWLLEGLIPESQTTSKTPWWLILLRTVLAAVILIALAQPVINPAQGLDLKGSIRLVMENGWSAGQVWNQQINAATTLLDRAERDRLQVYILTTAPEPGQTEPAQQGPMTAAQAKTVFRGLKPRSWPSDFPAASLLLNRDRPKEGIHSFWIGTGLDENRALELAKTLQQQGGLTYMEPEPSVRPLLLLPRPSLGNSLSAAVQAPHDIPAGLPVNVDAIGLDGRVLDQQKITLTPGKLPATVTFDLPDALRGQAGQIRISGLSGPGGVVILDDRSSRKTVGLFSSAKGEEEGTPLIDSGYYIRRALEPFADLRTGDIDSLLEIKGLSVMILPDIGALPAQTLEALEDWVRKGGLLVRFAGPNMSEGESFLTPVPLRRGERALSGNLTWDKPLKIAPFPASSPLYGLPLPPDIEVRQQLLPEQVSDMEKKTWAALDDGTPLVTAAPLDRGLVILVHTTATPTWSNLALSGLYVQMLQRFVSLSGVRDPMSIADGTLHPIRVLDGYGGLTSPDSTVLPVDAHNFEKQPLGSTHPPGIYGRSGMQRIKNIGDQVKSLNTMPSLPTGVTRTGFESQPETDLMPWLLAMAMVLFLADWIIMLILQGFGTGRLRFALRSALIVAFCLFSTNAQAQDNALDVKYASSIHLAHIQTGVAEVDNTARRGLENLAQVLTDRTSVEPGGVVGVNPETDDLSFFPLLYWPVTPQTGAPSKTMLQNIQSYLDHGGTILFDTRDYGISAQDDHNPPTLGMLSLRVLTGGLDVPPLTPAPDDHVLTKSFYLIRNYTGRYDNAILWVEEQSAIGRDGVSSIIVGGNDWASAWAGISPAQDTRQQEMAFRFGVNLMMYALTGNYKADQVHVPHILERLGQ